MKSSLAYLIRRSARTAVTVTAIAIPQALILAPASAQNASDCNGKPFPLRPFPQRVIEIFARQDSGDPLNTVVGQVYGRCLPNRVEVTLVCGAYARRSASGHLDQARDFYGEYLYSGSFRLISRGRDAVRSCSRNVLLLPFPD